MAVLVAVPWSVQGLPAAETQPHAAWWVGGCFGHGGGGGVARASQDDVGGDDGNADNERASFTELRATEDDEEEDDNRQFALTPAEEDEAYADSRHWRRSAEAALAPLPSAWRALARERAVWVGCSANVLAYAAEGFYNLALPSHLQRTLGLGPRGRGVIYLVPALLYAVMSPCMGSFCRNFGARNVLLAGKLRSARTCDSS